MCKTGAGAKTRRRWTAFFSQTDLGSNETGSSPFLHQFPLKDGPARAFISRCDLTESKPRVEIEISIGVLAHAPPLARIKVEFGLVCLVISKTMSVAHGVLRFVG
jgi:hypothetical protein